MKRSILLCTILLAACAPDAAEQPEAAAAAAPADTALEGTPMIGVVPEVQQQVEKAEADMAERAREAEAQVRAAEGGTPRP
jgi:hypothetical protein